MLVAGSGNLYAQGHRGGHHHRDGHRAVLTGKVASSEGGVIDFATVYLKGTSYGATTDAEGRYTLKAPAGEYTLVVSAIGYQTVEQALTLGRGERSAKDWTLRPDVQQLDEVVVVSSGVTRVKRSAFNAVAVDATEMQNTAKSLSDVLAKAPGMKLRESGGVGSDMQLMLDGFSGKHVKIFIDGVPQEGAGKALDLNNLPVNFAERIEVYKGVVPVGFGTDALGGVVNIVTGKQRRRWHVDASYSYGSFNTHKSYVNFGQTLKNGFLYEVNAFQNYSDNDYYIDNYITEFGEDGSESTDTKKIYRVKRFNDTFHNEAVIGRVGVVDKPWADRLTLGFNYSNYYKEIQTGVYQYIVFGQKHRKGHSFTPSLEYTKRNLFVRGLDVVATANYNHNLTQNIDTATYKYNWLGQRKPTGTPGEQSYQNSESKNLNWNATFTANYRISRAHTLTLNHVLSTFKRTSRSYVEGSNKLSDFSIPKVTRKNITGLSYRLMPTERWNLSAFGKYYNQYNRGPVSQSSDGIGDYVSMTQRVSSIGYGAAGTYFILDGLQAKVSYEKAYRLPTTDELFGDSSTKSRVPSQLSHNLTLGYSIRNGRYNLSLECRNLTDAKLYDNFSLQKAGRAFYGKVRVYFGG